MNKKEVQRNEKIEVRVTKAEKKKYKEKAALVGLTFSDYLREFLENGEVYVALFTDGLNSKLRGGNALICNVKSGNHGKGFIELKHFFYIPQGETEFKVY